MATVWQGYPIQVGPLLKNTDHLTGDNVGTPIVTIRKPNGSFAPPVGLVSFVGNGWLEIAANPYDTDTVGGLLVHVEMTDADPYDEKIDVIPVPTNPLTDLLALLQEANASLSELVHRTY